MERWERMWQSVIMDAGEDVHHDPLSLRLLDPCIPFLDIFKLFLAYTEGSVFFFLIPPLVLLSFSNNPQGTESKTADESRWNM